MKICGIYVITHLETGRQYVGQSIDIHRRWSGHCVPSAGKRSRLGRAIAKYGRAAFNFQILEECSSDRLDEAEVRWLELLDCRHPNGFNMMAAGQSNGRQSHPESREKLRESTNAYLARVGREGFCTSRGFAQKFDFTHEDGRQVFASCSDMRHLHGCAKPSYLVTRVRNFSDGWVLSERANELIVRRWYAHKDGRRVFCTAEEMRKTHCNDKNIHNLGITQRSCKGWSFAERREQPEAQLCTI